MKGIGIVLVSILFLFSIKGMDSKESIEEEGAKSLDSLSNSIDSAFVSMEAERIGLKIKLEQSLKETDKNLKAVEALLVVYNENVDSTTILKERQVQLLKKKEKFYNALQQLSEKEISEWQKRKTELEESIEND